MLFYYLGLIRKLTAMRIICFILYFSIYNIYKHLQYLRSIKNNISILWELVTLSLFYFLRKRIEQFVLLP
jgi:hypothetical protein